MPTLRPLDYPAHQGEGAMQVPDNRMQTPENRGAVQAPKAPNKRERPEGVTCKWCQTIARHKIRNQWSIEGGKVRRKRFCVSCHREFLTDEATSVDELPSTGA